MNPPVEIREATPADWDFIRKAWRNSYQCAPAVEGTDRTHYFHEMSRLFAAIVPSASVRIACDPSDAENCLGFACYKDTVLHYVYVLRADGLDFRRYGIAKRLLDGLPINAYSFSTGLFVKRIKPRERQWQYRPRFTHGS